jgi:hypothetical protein
MTERRIARCRNHSVIGQCLELAVIGMMPLPTIANTVAIAAVLAAASAHHG